MRLMAPEGSTQLQTADCPGVLVARVASLNTTRVHRETPVCVFVLCFQSLLWPRRLLAAASSRQPFLLRSPILPRQRPPCARARARADNSTRRRAQTADGSTIATAPALCQYICRTRDSRCRNISSIAASYASRPRTANPSCAWPSTSHAAIRSVTTRSPVPSKPRPCRSFAPPLPVSCSRLSPPPSRLEIRFDPSLRTSDRH